MLMRRYLWRCLPLKLQKDDRTKETRICISVLIVSTLCTLLGACGGGLNAPSVQGSVAGTSNPLVAQYTVASACRGQAMVEFGPDTAYGRNTSWYALAGDYRKTTILVAGMRAGTAYHMRAQVQCSGATIATEDTTFTTGALPSSVTFPAVRITRPDPSQANAEGPG